MTYWKYFLHSCLWMVVPFTVGVVFSYFQHGGIEKPLALALFYLAIFAFCFFMAWMRCRWDRTSA